MASTEKLGSITGMNPVSLLDNGNKIGDCYGKTFRAGTVVPDELSA
ncbi:MAG: hypothetical protein JWP69_1674 [Flaviaesturariibacter sp.]|nr:hypothetical protein [Flaviaesturariibacter sp.]